MKRLIGILLAGGFVAAMAACAVDDPGQNGENVNVAAEAATVGQSCFTDTCTDGSTCCVGGVYPHTTFTCRDLQSDTYNCGTCGHVCYCNNPLFPNAHCFQGGCICS